MKSGPLQDCGCNDYSLLTANTGIATVSTANSTLGGGAPNATVITGRGDNGTTVRSITIKAFTTTKTGMVRLFVKNAAGTITTLYREIPITTNPQLSATPTPTPILPMVEVKLMDGLRLAKDATLVATTQNADSFNIIAEGLDEKYPAELPSACCNYIQCTAVIGNGVLSTANTNLDGSGTIVTVLSAPSSATSAGTMIKSITIAAMQSTHEGMVRLFISPSGTPDYSLWTEVHVPETIQSGYQPSYKQILNEPLYIEAGYQIGASTHNAEGFAVTIEGESWEYPIS